MQDHITTPPHPRARFDPDTYEIDPDTGALLLPLGSKKRPGMFALVDREDAVRIAKHPWWPIPADTRALVHENFYAVTRKGLTTSVAMHRVILDVADPRFQVDHINHNGLDNRRANLRIITNQENQYNRRHTRKATSSRFKGVSWHKSSRKWVVRIRKDEQLHYLGGFDNEMEAAVMYDFAARELFGEYAYLNFPLNGERGGNV